MSIKVRIFLITALSCLTIIAVGGIGLYGMKNTVGYLQRMYNERIIKILQLSEIMTLLRENRIQLLLALQHDPDNPDILKLHDHPVSRHIDKIEQNRERISAIWSQFEKSKMTEEGRKLGNELTASRAAYMNNAMKPAIEAIKVGDFRAASEISAEKIPELFKSVDDLQKRLYERQSKQALLLLEKANKTYKTDILLMIALIIAALVVSALLSWKIINSIMTATRTLISSSNAMANGDLTVRANLHSKDELGVIAGAFDEMGNAFSQLISQVSFSSSQVAAAASQVSSSAERIATGSEEVAAQSVTVATASEEMAATSSDIARNCQGAAEGASLAAATTQQGFEVVRNTVDGIRSRGEKTEENAKIIISLGERSDQIGAIVATIEDIADQTNLLALNAAIEAARAGEYGRGFAVVADEVRALAERTTKATKEISDMIKTIQIETRQAITSIEEGVRGTQKGAEEAGMLETALQDILNRVSDVTEQVNQIATAAEEQTATTSEISSNIHQITNVVQDTVTGAHESAGAAKALNQQAEQLQQLVRRFRF